MTTNALTNQDLRSALAAVRADLRVLKWMLALTTVLTGAVFLKLCT